MDFSLTEEQTAVQQLASQILGDLATTEQQKVLDQQSLRFDQHLWHSLAEAGLLGVAIDEAYGGMAMGFETLCIVLEEIGKTVAALPALGNLVTASLAIQQFADERIKLELLPKVAAGELILTAAISEAHRDEVMSSSVTYANHRLNGVKHLVPFAEQSGYLLLAAQDVASQEMLVLLVDAKASGLTVTAQRATSGEPQASVHLQDVWVDDTALIARGESAQHMLKSMRDYTLAGTAAMALGVAEGMLQMTATYTAERQQFGVPIASFQAVSHRAADCYIDVENLRLVTQQAVSQLDRGLAADDEVLIAKIWAGDVLHRVSQASQHLHGGIGVDRDYPLFRFCLWAKQLEMTLGSSSVYLAELGDNIADEFKQALG